MLKRFLCALMLIAMVCALTLVMVSCNGQDGYDICVNEFFEALKSRDYQAIYSIMTPTSQTLISQ